MKPLISILRLQRLSNWLSKGSMKIILYAPLLVFVTFCSTVSSQSTTPHQTCIDIIKNPKSKDFLKALGKKNCPLALQVSQWLQLKEGQYQGSFEEAGSLLESHPWPNMGDLYQKLEALISPHTPTKVILDWFTKHPPSSGMGGYYHLKAQEEQRTLNHKLAGQYWVQLNFQQTEEKVFLEHFNRFLTSTDHWKRVQRLLWDERIEAAQRLMGKLSPPQQALVHARIALIRGEPTAERLVKQVPKKLQHDEGLLYNRTKWKRQRQKEGAHAYLLAHPHLKKSPHAAFWIKERIALARELLQRNHYKTAYQLVSDTGVSNGVDYAEAEWLAGWLSLTFLKDSKSAVKHFTTLYKNVLTPLSKSRAAYWAGQAWQDQKNQEKAQEWFMKATQYPSTYYGQLAHRKQTHQSNSKKPSQKSTSKTPPGHKVPLHEAPHKAADQAAFEQNHHPEIVKLLAASNQEAALKMYLAHLADLLPTKEQCLLLISTLEQHAPNLVIDTIKKMSKKGEFLIPAAYPVILLDKQPAIDPALTHAIIRQESCFDPKAISPVGARGLMQLMVATAKEVGRKMRVTFSNKDLLEKPKLNVFLGQAYFKRLLDAYDGSLVLALAAYNGGPHNVRKWIKDQGDPRNPSVNVDHWIERIPFKETRNYIQRVLENYEVYKQRL